MRARQLIPLIMVVAAGCKSPPKLEPKAMDAKGAKDSSGQAQDADAKAEAKPATGLEIKVSSTRGRCRRSLCIGGPGEPGSHAHFDLNELCRRSRGSLERCEAGVCTSVWPSDQWKAGLDALVASLDRDGDGKVQGPELDCPVNLGGWSTGAGIAATQLAAGLVERVPELELENLVLVAPHLAGGEQSLPIDPHFRRAFIYRSTRVGEDDCSKDFAGGPWKSPAPSCAENTTCFDYDYAIQGDLLAYIGRRGNRTGWEIDSCSMTSFVANIGVDNLDDGVESYSNRVPPYAGTKTRGGRDPHARPAPE